MKKTFIFTLLVMISMTMAAQKVNYAVNKSTGLLSRVSIKSDVYRMNWVQQYIDSLNPMAKAYKWGASVNMKKRHDGLTGHVRTDVKRWNNDYDLFEEYTITNETNEPYNLADLRFSLPFNTNPDVGSSKHQRCDVTVDLESGTKAYVKAVRQSGKSRHIALVLQKGKFSSYEMTEVEKPNGNNNGRYVLTVRPEDIVLKPGKSYTIKWCVFSYEDDDDFPKQLKHRGWKENKK